MTVKNALFACFSFAVLTGAAHAQQNTPTPVDPAPLAPLSTGEDQESDQNADANSESTQNASVENEPVNPDEMAASLNSQQQLKQTFTLTRTINGVVVEKEQKTVTYSPSDPHRATEAGKSTLERLKEAFDGELLTRKEAFEEAKLDFTIADVNRDGKMTEEEFAELVASWRENEKREPDAPNEEIARQRQYDAFIAEIDPDAARLQYKAFAKEKFAFLAGSENTVSRKDYIREYLLDFDSMDVNKDAILRDEELLRFRALNRGETIDM